MTKIFWIVNPLLILIMAGTKISGQHPGNTIKLEDASSTNLPEVVLQDRNSMDAEVVDMDARRVDKVLVTTLPARPA